VNCDRIAPFYWLFERIAFGGALQKHRLAFLSAAEGKRRVLILGDGDGRFTRALLSAHPDGIEIDSIELSAGMVAQARKRNVSMIQADALEYPFRQASYDVVFTHFFLDCFASQQANTLIARVAASLTGRAIWIVSDFKQASSGWRKIYTRVWLAVMYLFFGFMTGLKTRSLPDHAPALLLAGFSKRNEQLSSFGLIASEWWQR